MNSTITKLEIQKRNKERVNIYVDNEYKLSCSVSIVYTHNLVKGKKIDTEVLTSIVREDDYIKSKNTALRFIEKSYKSENKLREKLKGKEFDEDTINRTIKFLKDYGFLNDEKYIKAIIKEKMKAASRKKIQYNLNKKGFDKKIIDENIIMVDETVERESCEKLASKKLTLLQKTEKNKGKIKEKLYKYLLANGYEYSISKAVIYELMKNFTWDEEENEKNYTDETELRQIAQKRYNIISKTESDPQKIYRRLGNYLIRRGYNLNAVNKIIREILNL